MCLILFAYDAHPDYPLIFAGNRDEFYGRPTAAADVWDDAPHVLGGRDLKSGGTWLGVTRSGHWATVTNVRDPSSPEPDAPSRGHLVADYLKREPEAKAFATSVAQEADRYNPFNLMVGTPDTLWFVSNRNGPVRAIEPGVHGLSNGALDEPWPKVERGTRRLESVVDDDDVRVDRLLEILSDRRPAPDEELPDTGLDLERERQVSAAFIEGEEYGTRSSSVLLIHRSGTITFVERTFDHGTPRETNRFSFDVVSDETERGG